MYHLIHDCSLFVLVRLYVCCSFIFRLSFVCSTTSPSMVDCYVPPHPHFCSLFFSFVRCLFVICSSFVCCLFVHHSFVVRSLFVQQPHLPWLIFMYHFIRVCSHSNPMSMGGEHTAFNPFLVTPGRRLLIPRCIISFAISFFENFARYMASGTVRPGAFRRVFTACSTLARCAALF
jgi:hypothetical protein